MTTATHERHDGMRLRIEEHHLAAELADDRREFTASIEHALDAWDAVIDRLQTCAAALGPVERTQAEWAVADLRRRRMAIAESLAGVRAARGEAWRDARKRVVAALDELKRKSDAASRG